MSPSDVYQIVAEAAIFFSVSFLSYPAHPTAPTVFLLPLLCYEQQFVHTFREEIVLLFLDTSKTTNENCTCQMCKKRLHRVPVILVYELTLGRVTKAIEPCSKNLKMRKAKRCLKIISTRVMLSLQADSL